MLLAACMYRRLPDVLILLQCEGTVDVQLSLKCLDVPGHDLWRSLSGRPGAQWPFAIWYQVETVERLLTAAGIAARNP